MNTKELSPAEYRVAEEVAKGYSEKEIAHRLCISPNTVHNHTYRIRKKWNARGAVDVARKFILQLDEPKKFFLAVTFLIIQTHLVFAADLMDMRKPNRVRIRNYKIARKYS